MVKDVIIDLFNHNGLLSGGAAVAYMFNEQYAKDLDFFFNDYNTYLKLSKEYKYCNHIDIVYYVGNDPYDGFDIDISQCCLDKNGNLHQSLLCQKAFNSKTVGIIKKNVIRPRLTLSRLYKYSAKYNLDIDKESIEYLWTLLKRLQDSLPMTQTSS